MFPCSCYETKMLPDLTAGIMLVIGQTPPAVREYTASSHSRVNACNWSEAPCVEGMNLLIGQLSFPRPLVGMVFGLG